MQSRVTKHQSKAWVCRHRDYESQRLKVASSRVVDRRTRSWNQKTKVRACRTVFILYSRNKTETAASTLLLLSLGSAFLHLWYKERWDEAVSTSIARSNTMNYSLVPLSTSDHDQRNDSISALVWNVHCTWTVASCFKQRWKYIKSDVLDEASWFLASREPICAPAAAVKSKLSGVLLLYYASKTVGCVFFGLVLCLSHRVNPMYDSRQPSSLSSCLLSTRCKPGSCRNHPLNHHGGLEVSVVFILPTVSSNVSTKQADFRC